MSELDALQECLAHEHLMVHACGVLGARTSASAAPELHAALALAYREHRARRDALRGFVIDAGGEPVPAEPDYVVPSTWSRVPGITTAALELEQSSAEHLTALVATSSGPVRRWALTSLVWSATHELAYGAPPQVWPGAPELPWGEEDVSPAPEQ